MIKRKYSWLPDLPDHRDYCFAPKPHILANLPTETNLQSNDTPVVDQGNLGACVGNSSADADFHVKKILGLENIALPSRLAIYWGARNLEGTVKTDSGSQIRDAFKIMATVGAADEALWKYDIAKFAKKPPVKYFTQAKKHKILNYYRLNNRNIDELKSCLAEGFPFVHGFSVYETFESQTVAQSGVVPMPAKKEKMLGGHAVKAIGYSDKDARFLIKNSWGVNWGQSGYFTIPYEYLTSANLADDFWTLRSSD